MIRILCILCLGLLCCSAIAQNPFDIKNRKNKVPVKANDFEKPTTATIKDITPTKVAPATTPLEKSTSTPVQVSPVAQQTTPTKNSNIHTSSNPFDVSHIPVTGTTKKTIEKAFTPIPVKEKVTEEETAIVAPSNAIEAEEKTKPNIRIAQKRKFLERNLPFLLLFISLLILAFVVGFTKKTITNVIRSTYNENFMKLTNKQSNNGKSTAFLLLYTLFFINLALLIFLFTKDKTELHSGLLFLYIFLALVFAYLVRHIFLFILGVVFKDIKKEASQYSFTIEVFNICAGLALLPLNFFISFGSENLAQFCLYLAIGVFGLIFVIRTIRAILLSSRYLVRNKFHYFLYLCTCEIGPVFVLIKILTDYL